MIYLEAARDFLRRTAPAQLDVHFVVQGSVLGDDAIPLASGTRLIVPTERPRHLRLRVAGAQGRLQLDSRVTRKCSFDIARLCWRAGPL